MPAHGATCAHDHDCEGADCGPAYSLYKHIDLHKVCVNCVMCPWPPAGVFSTSPVIKCRCSSRPSILAWCPGRAIHSVPRKLQQGSSSSNTLQHYRPGGLHHTTNLGFAVAAAP
jgi:hypothetical protein